ncbi:Tyrosine-protein kinase csk-1 [Echinococcus granulosus]|nr:Tyrosine-protein kinase csk-1 [Echinococcus granulosus]
MAVHLNAEEYLLPLSASEIPPRSTSGEKQFNGNTPKHEAMVKESTEGVSKDAPGTHSSDSTQAKSNWKKVTTLLVSASRFMGDVKFGPLQQKTTYSSPQATGGVHCSSDLENIWTPSYYGDEEDFAKEQKDVSANWALFSTKDGRLLLKRGPHGKSYFVNGQYEVEMNDHVVTGELLSEFIENVRRAECDADEANQRKCASLIYYKDLKRFAGSKEIEPLVKKEGAKTIGMGEFGEVTLRTYPEEGSRHCDANDETPSRQVAVKRIKQTSRNALVGAMEVAVMCAILEDSNISVQHLLPLIGWYLDDEDLYVVTEFMPGGSLLDYLQSLNLKGEEEVGEEEVHKQRLELHRFVAEIASGMCALEAKQIQHRDLAARNILLTQHRQIKIGDFGLSRPDGSKFTCGRISTRWTAPEVLQNEADFTLRSDVWSFGVVMWEIYSLGSLPYSEVPSRELLNHLHSGRRLDPPYATPSRIAKLMNMCWQMSAPSRPSFVEIDLFLHGLLMRQGSDAPFTVPPPLPAKIFSPPASSPPPSSYIEL